MKKLAIKLLSSAGLPSLLQRVVAPHSIAVLAYHGVIGAPLPFQDWCFIDIASFRRQMAYLRDHFHVASLSEAVAMIKSGEVPGPTVVITFDDGFRNNYTRAFPVLQEFGLPATVYLATAYVDTPRLLWFTTLLEMLARTEKTQLTWDGEVFDLSDVVAREKASPQIQRKLKRLPGEALTDELKDIARLLEVPVEYHAEETSAFRMLCREEIRQMVDSGLVEFGAHTVSHHILQRLDAVQQADQIRRSIEQVSELTGRPCRHFAYPNGGADDYGEQSMTILREAGIESAVTMLHGPVGEGTPLLEINRYGIGTDTSFDRFKLMAHNIC